MSQLKEKKSPWRSFAGAVIMVSVAAIAGQSVIAGLNATATNTAAQNINTGTMKLEFNPTSTSAGFTQSIENLVPGDVVNRYITLQNTGTINGRDLKLSLATASDNTQTLINDGSTTRALGLTVDSCSVPWNQTSGVCDGGTTSSVLTRKVLGALATANPLTPSTLNAGGLMYLRMQIDLPNQSETTVNGNITSPTVQGGRVDITYTFDLTQRVAQPINS